MSFPLEYRVKQDVKEYEILTVIGEGNFCTVHSALHVKSGKRCAIKSYEKSRISRMKKFEDVIMEKHVLLRLKHSHIVRLIDTFTDTDFAYVVTELCQDGELWDVCKRWGEPERRAKRYILQLFEAIEYMHRSGIAHRDLKGNF